VGTGKGTPSVYFTNQTLDRTKIDPADASGFFVKCFTYDACVTFYAKIRRICIPTDAITTCIIGLAFYSGNQKQD